MSFDHEFILLIPIKKLDIFCDRVQNFEKYYAESSYFDNHCNDLTVEGSIKFVQDVQDRVSKCLLNQKVDWNYSSKLNINFRRDRQSGWFQVRCNFYSLDYWSEKFGCFPVHVYGDFSRRGVTSLLQENNRSMFYAFLEIFPITLGFYEYDGASASDEDYQRRRKEVWDYDLRFYNVLFLGDEIFNLLEEYFVEEIDFFFKKKIAQRKYLLAGDLMYSESRMPDVLDIDFSDGELNQNDYVIRHKKLFELLRTREEERLKLLGLPRKIPDYKDWESKTESID
jgi:hypothetical protein